MRTAKLDGDLVDILDLDDPSWDGPENGDAAVRQLKEVTAGLSANVAKLVRSQLWDPPRIAFPQPPRIAFPQESARRFARDLLASSGLAESLRKAGEAARRAIKRSVPANLLDDGSVDVDLIGFVVAMAFDEGVPIAWVPQLSIIEALVAADSREERLDLLVLAQDQILGDCEEALVLILDERSKQCRVAIAALRAGLEPAAQSHAANVVDSILRVEIGHDGVKDAKEVEPGHFETQPLREWSRFLALAPVGRAYAPWWPSDVTPPPDHFVRHATAHAVGHEGVFTPANALIATMLATSLTVEFSSSDSVGARTSQ